MILSASRRTDIPAFFGEWWMNRIKEGYVYWVHPFNPKQVKVISLAPQDVDAIVFWTKNPQPFLKYLDEMDSRGYRYYFTFTLNDYPKELEPNVPKVEARIETFQQLSEKIGPKKVIWRYDPIIISSTTPFDYHLQKISSISNDLKGYTHRLVISFLDFYAKTNNKLKKLQKAHGIRFMDIREKNYREEMISFCWNVQHICAENGIEVVSCAEKADLTEAGIQPGSCIDGELLEKLFYLGKVYKKDSNQRPECGCVQSVDIGVYNTCLFDCQYCYAVQSKKAVQNRLKKHDKNSPALIGDFKTSLASERTEV